MEGNAGLMKYTADCIDAPCRFELLQGNNGTNGHIAHFSSSAFNAMADSILGTTTSTCPIKDDVNSIGCGGSYDGFGGFSAGQTLSHWAIGQGTQTYSSPYYIALAQLSNNQNPFLMSRAADNSPGGAFQYFSSLIGGNYSPVATLWYVDTNGNLINNGGISTNIHEMFLNERSDTSEMGRIRCNGNGAAGGGTPLPCFMEFNQAAPSTSPYIGTTYYISTTIAGKACLGQVNLVSWPTCDSAITSGNDSSPYTSFPLVVVEPVLHTPPTVNHLATFNHNGCDTNTITGCTAGGATGPQVMSIQDSVTAAVQSLGYNFGCSTSISGSSPVYTGGVACLASGTVTNAMQIGGLINSGTNQSGSSTYIGPNIGTGNTNPFDTIVIGSAAPKGSGSTAQVPVQRMVVTRYKNPGTSSPAAINLFTIPMANNTTAQLKITASAEVHDATPHNCSTEEEFFVVLQKTGTGSVTSNISNVTPATICDSGTLMVAVAASNANPSQITVTWTWTLTATATASYYTIQNFSQSDITLQ
jgi:hypothetical protein